MKKFIIDIINIDKQKYHDVLGKIKRHGIFAYSMLIISIINFFIITSY